MRYLKNYTQHNEGFKKSLIGAGLAGGLLLTNPTTTKSQDMGLDLYNPTKMTEPLNYYNPNSPLNPNNQINKNAWTDDTPKSEDDVKPNDEKVKNYKDAKAELEILSQMRQAEFNHYRKDQQLNSILDEIKSNVDSTDPKQLELMFSKLSDHMKVKYGYEIKVQKLENLDQNKIKGLSIMEILGWIGSLCLAICGVPQAWQSFKDKNSDGISWAFLLLWTFGEIFALAYVYEKADLPLLLNYGFNILILFVILYYKKYPTQELKDFSQ